MIGGDDLLAVAEAAAAPLRAVPEQAWTERAGSLEWTRRETAAHIVNAMFGYASRLAIGHMRGRLPFQLAVPDDAPHEDLVELVRSAAAVLASVIDGARPDTVAYHPYGTADAEAFAAMGIVELAVHTDDITAGLGIAWAPPQGPLAGALERLFPNRPRHDDAWAVLRHCTGREALPRVEPVGAAWRWQNER